jgi:hypothetical protein
MAWHFSSKSGTTLMTKNSLNLPRKSVETTKTIRGSKKQLEQQIFRNEKVLVPGKQSTIQSTLER